LRTTLELPDPLFVRLKARAALERTTIKQMLRVFVEEGLGLHEQSGERVRRRAEDLPQAHGELPLKPEQLSNASLFELLNE
jgi:hypothetical protein